MIAATGTQYSVKLEDWREFVTNGLGTVSHPVEQEALAEILPELRLLWTDPGPLIEHAEVPPLPPAERARIDARRKQRTFNRAARRAAERAKQDGARCPSERAVTTGSGCYQQ